VLRGAALGLLLGVAAVLPSVAAPAAPAPPAPAPEPVLPGLRTANETVVMSKEGRAYRIFVSVPRGQAPASGFPVITVLDGNGWFGMAVEVARMREYEKLPPAIVVGVGYPGNGFFDGVKRSYDFTAPGTSDPDMDGIKLGGADAFLAFLTGTLRSWVAAHCAADPKQQVLFGHSLGGTFVLHALFKAPESFNVYLAASPDLPFSDRAIVKEEPAFESNPARSTPRVLLTVGELEAHPSAALMDDYRRYYAAHPELIPGYTPDQAVAELFADKGDYDKVADTRDLTARLAKAGVKAAFVEFAGEEHMSAGVAALNRGIPFALRPESQTSAP
jgi:hypothetical protein